MPFVVKWSVDKKAIVDAASTQPAAVAACRAKAGEIVAAANRNLAPYQPRSPREALSKERAAGGLGVLEPETFERKDKSLIPVALAVADGPDTARWEFGSGFGPSVPGYVQSYRTPQTRYLSKAARAARRGGWAAPK